MNFIKHLIGTRIAVIITILTCLTILNSCSKDIDSYQFTISNEYFESLYHTEVGNIIFDTLLVNETTPETIINKGTYGFTAETESGLILRSTIKLRGDRKNVKLIVNKNGKLITE